MFDRPRLLPHALASLLALPASAQSSGPADVRLDTALSLAIMLQSARSVIGANQDLINDPARADKGLSGERVLEDALAAYLAATGEDARDVDPGSAKGRLLRAQMAAITRVMEENRATIDREGVGFKGFVPAVFARLVNEDFARAAGTEASVKVTAPPELVRNRKARPDAWEAEVIETRLDAGDWEAGAVFHQAADVDGRGAYRVLVPEYYTDGCLACHGGPAGEIDITGYPMEGGALGDLGGVISITLFDPE